MREIGAVALVALLVCALAPVEARSLLQNNATGGNGVPTFDGVGDFQQWMVDAGLQGRVDIFKETPIGPAPNGTYQAFLIESGDVDDFGLSGTQKAVLSFVISGFIGKTFSGDGDVTNVLVNDGGFDAKALEGTIGLEPGFVDGNDSWVTRFPGTINDFIVDEFREIQDGFIIGRTYFGPDVELGDATMFECGLVRVALTLPEGKTAKDVILEAREDGTQGSTGTGDQAGSG